jgi:hypothetical protein
VGLFDDWRKLRDASNESAGLAGRPSTTRGRIRNLPADLAAAGEAARFAADQQAQASSAAVPIPGGLSGTALLRGGFRATGELVGFEPVGDVDLEIRLDGRDSYQQTVRLVVPHRHLVRMVNGSEFNVLVDPNDRSAAQIVWPD